MPQKRTENPTVNNNHTIQIDILCEVDKILSIVKAKELAKRAGFNEHEAFMIATAVSELATNILRYAKEGKITLMIVQNIHHTGISVLAEDQGPGIRDIDKAMSEHYSEGKSLGLGLSSVKRIMSEFDIESVIGHGTRITAKKWI